MCLSIPLDAIGFGFQGWREDLFDSILYRRGVVGSGSVFGLSLCCSYLGIFVCHHWSYVLVVIIYLVVTEVGLIDQLPTRERSECEHASYSIYGCKMLLLSQSRVSQ